jgi:hypothetical protein
MAWRQRRNGIYGAPGPKPLGRQVAPSTRRTARQSTVASTNGAYRVGHVVSGEIGFRLEERRKPFPLRTVNIPVHYSCPRRPEQTTPLELSRPAIAENPAAPHHCFQLIM